MAVRARAVRHGRAAVVHVRRRGGAATCAPAARRGGSTTCTQISQCGAVAVRAPAARLCRMYRGVCFTRPQIYLLSDVSAIQRLTNLSVRVWSLDNASKNILKSPFLCYYRKKICVRLRLIAKFQLCLLDLALKMENEVYHSWITVLLSKKTPYIF